MELFNINETDVILQQLGKKEGKIIIANSGYGNYSYQWNSIGGGDLKRFLCNMNEGYFIDKLCKTRQGKLNIRQTMAGFRKQIADNLPFWKEMEFQKELRAELKQIEKSGIDDAALLMSELSSLCEYRLDFDSIKDNWERREIEGLIRSIFTDEVWHCFIYDEPVEYSFLRDLHKDLKLKLQTN